MIDNRIVASSLPENAPLLSLLGHPPRQFSFFFCLFLALPRLLLQKTASESHAGGEAEQQGNVIRNTLTPLHSWSSCASTILRFFFQIPLAGSSTIFCVSWIPFYICVNVQYLGERWDRLTWRQKAPLGYILFLSFRFYCKQIDRWSLGFIAHLLPYLPSSEHNNTK